MYRVLAWILALFTSRKNERAIYSYFDGDRQRSIDPLVAWRKIFGHPEINLESSLKIIFAPKMVDGRTPYTAEEIYAAEDSVRRLTREAFGVSAFSDTQPGLTCEETDRLLFDFLDSMEVLKKKRATLQMTSPASASTPRPGSTDTPGDSDTTSPSASGSTGTESSDAAPSGS